MNILQVCSLISLILNASQNPIYVQKDPMETLGLFEGDIMGVNPNNKGVLDTETTKWTNGIVYYTIDNNSYAPFQLQTIYAGMKMIEDQTKVDGRDCIKFIPRTTQNDYIRITSGTGCWSYMGMIGGQQLVSLNNGGCVYAGTIAHELIHALGFHHEQSRADRDDYVTINYENIDPANAFNFDKQLEADYQGFPYDYYSIMHYDSKAFSKNGKVTIVPKQSGVQLTHPSYKNALTDIDAGEIKKRYGCI